MRPDHFCHFYDIVVEFCNNNDQTGIVNALHLQGPSAAVGNLSLRPRFSQHPRDLANVNA